ncbi:MAG: prepilin-type N-terminal cleavage/methylation domain-containing protein [Verrucomicrobia bacterium]|nr:prepilin-type N-terminal cleavage/methylation domain-containing protein [Verrucomicrobiota bacterium]
MSEAGQSGRRQPAYCARRQIFLTSRSSPALRLSSPATHHSSLVTRRSQRSGFTLIETIAVIVIIMLAVGVGMPTFLRTYRSEILRSETSVLRSTIQHARYQAIVRQHAMSLNMDFSQQTYWIEMPDIVETNLVLQVLSLSTNALAFTDGTAPDTAPQADDLSTNAVIVALPTSTRHEMVSPARLLQLQAVDSTATASGVASISFYPNGACQGGTILLGNANDDTVAIELDPLTSLSKLLPNAPMR